jgi:hypothetical protein
VRSTVFLLLTAVDGVEVCEQMFAIWMIHFEAFTVNKGDKFLDYQQCQCETFLLHIKEDSCPRMFCHNIQSFEIFVLLGCYTTFQDNLLAPSSRVKQVYCPEVLVINYQPTLHNNTEEQSTHLHCGGIR